MFGFVGNDIIDCEHSGFDVWGSEHSFEPFIVSEVFTLVVLWMYVTNGIFVILF